MSSGYSIRARLFFGAALVLVAFIAAAGAAVQRAHTDSVRAVHFGRLQATVYLLLAKAELDDQGSLVMPAEFSEPRLSLPASGLYARIRNIRRNEDWRSGSSVGVDPPFPQDAPPARGEWRNEEVQARGRNYLSVSYSVNWAAGSTPAPLALTVMEDSAEFDREIATFAHTLWAWLGSASVLLLLAQTLLLQWGLAPLRRISGEVARIESGEQSKVEGRYPNEISGLTDNLNTLIAQERVRQARYREALSFLAHSLKTPLAVLRNALGEPQRLPDEVRQQVARMDDIVQHQLARAAAGGTSKFAPPIAIAPVLHRLRDALTKVHAQRGVEFTVDAAPDLAFRIDEGDLMEIAGNLMDNAGKWAHGRVEVRAWREGARLHLSVDDDGPGFSDTQSVLRIHVRGDERVPGHGVGLASVNEIVASHDGELRLGTSPGLRGARVEVVLPA
ncbi:ATP-binding protein [Ramlibacter albus]|uniref:histidine kinase n=1 Tax=Ramlibacter albus TaxID=2079448 RepID=A0A923MFJ2_9BURK|nr:ATP-binding protein [Ramlibacter albus]MBC5768519.1 histidine kinase [Ramlibacter albus]